MRGYVWKAVVGICLIWFCLSIYQISLYEDDIYDCSNMVADQEHFFNSVGIDTKIGIRYKTDDQYAHVWLILPFDIPFECTILSIELFGYEPDAVFDSVEDLILHHPDTKDEFTLSTK